MTAPEAKLALFEDYKITTLRMLHQQAHTVDEGMGPVLEFLNSLDGIATTGCCAGHEDERAYLAFAVRDKDLWQYLQTIFEGALRQPPYRIKGVSFDVDTWNTEFVRRLVVINLDLSIQGAEGAEVLSECAMSVGVAVRAQEDGMLETLMNKRVM